MKNPIGYEYCFGVYWTRHALEYMFMFICGANRLLRVFIYLFIYLLTYLLIYYLFIYQCFFCCFVCVSVCAFVCWFSTLFFFIAAEPPLCKSLNLAKCKDKPTRKRHSNNH